MSRDTESTMSSAVSISGLESLSDEGSTLSIRGDKTGMSGSSANGLFDLGDGDLYIKANDITLETHKFLIKKFAGLKDRIKNDTITLLPGEPEPEDFRNTFKILYASVIEGPFDFDHATLISALLLATRYDYPALRSFTIDKLESAEMSPVERIRLTREFDIPSWEEPAFLVLCERDDPLTMPEAEVLGLEAVLYVGVVREREQRRRREEAEATIAKGVAKGSSPELDEKLDSNSNPNPSPTPIPNPNPAPASALDSGAAPIDANPLPKPSFIDDPDLSSRDFALYCSDPNSPNPKIELPVPDCDCKVTLNGWAWEPTCKCKLPPCAVSALKHLQTQQLAHKSNISALKTAVEQIQAGISSLKPMADSTDENPVPSPSPSSSPSSPLSTSLQDDVKKWLVRQGAGLRLDK